MKLSFGMVFLVFGTATAMNRILDFLSDDVITQVNNAQRLWRAGRNFSPNTSMSQLFDLIGTEMNAFTMLWNVPKFSDPKWPPDQNVPEFFDARQRWPNCTVIGEILDQSKCGSCWAVSPAQIATDRYCIASNGRHNIRLSGQEILGCTLARFHQGCSGGVPTDALKFIRRNGLVSGGDHGSDDGCIPYFMPKCAHHGAGPLTPCEKVKRLVPECDLSCTNPSYKKSFEEDVRRFSTMYRVASVERWIMRDIMTYGPLSTQFKVFPDFFLYKSGVYEPITPSFLNGSTTRVPISARTPTSLRGHALKIIGWGTESGVPYWLGVNSWNEHWGEKGIVKLKRQSSLINVEEWMLGILPAVEPKFYKNQTPKNIYRTN